MGEEGPVCEEEHHSIHKGLFQRASYEHTTFFFWPFPDTHLLSQIVGHGSQILGWKSTLEGGINFWSAKTHSFSRTLAEIERFIPIFLSGCSVCVNKRDALPHHVGVGFMREVKGIQLPVEHILTLLRLFFSV